MRWEVSPASFPKSLWLATICINGRPFVFLPKSFPPRHFSLPDPLSPFFCYVSSRSVASFSIYSKSLSFLSPPLPFPRDPQRPSPFQTLIFTQPISCCLLSLSLSTTGSCWLNVGVLSRNGCTRVSSYYLPPLTRFRFFPRLLLSSPVMSSSKAPPRVTQNTPFIASTSFPS